MEFTVNLLLKTMIFLDVTKMPQLKYPIFSMFKIDKEIGRFIIPK